MAEQTLNVRLQLKYDEYSKWYENNPKLNKGEVAIATIPTGDTNGVSTELPAVIIKVGDGEHNYNDLPIIHAKSADVHSWAKAATKPEYTADEIKGLDTFISAEIQDTDTQYQIVKVTDYQYKLQSKKLGEEAWSDVADSVINIPQYDDTQVKADIDALEALVGTTSVAAQIAAAIEGLKLAETYAAKVHTHTKSEITDFAHNHEIGEVNGLQDALDGKQAVGDYATKTEAQGYADAKDEAIAEAKKAGTDAASALETYKSANDAAVALKADTTALEAEVNRATGAESGLNTRLEKVEAFFEGAAEDGEGLANALDTLKEIQDYITGDGAAAEEMLDAIDANTKAIEDHETLAAQTYETKEDATSKNNAMDGRVAAIEAKVADYDDAVAKEHEHANKALLDTYTQTEADLADAVAKKHEHANKAILDGITAAPILTTDTLILNCGDSNF